MNMKFFIAAFLTALTSFLACLYLPWWTIAIAAFVIAVMIPQKPHRAFITGFLALFLLWGSLAFLISRANEHFLAKKISLVILKTDSHFLLIFITAMIGALVAGFGALSGSYLRKVE